MINNRRKRWFESKDNAVWQRIFSRYPSKQICLPLQETKRAKWIKKLEAAASYKEYSLEVTSNQINPKLDSW